MSRSSDEQTYCYLLLLQLSVSKEAEMNMVTPLTTGIHHTCSSFGQHLTYMHELEIYTIILSAAASLLIYPVLSEISCRLLDVVFAETVNEELSS